MDHNIFTPDRFASPTRVVEILKDTRGFGFVVAGDKPVFIQTVREGGAAERAGLLKNDVIIKVNGVPVFESNHSEVVSLIKAAGPFVTLSLISQNSFNGYSSSSPAMPLSPGLQYSSSIHGPDSGKDRSISGPKPVDGEQQRVLDMSTVRTLQTMFQTEEETRDKLKVQQSKYPNPRTAVELANSEERLKGLQRKISNISGNRDWMSSSMSSSQLNAANRSPPTKRPHSTFGPRRSDLGSHESEEESPPPLPYRSTSRMLNPLASPVLSPVSADRRFGSPEVAPPLPPRNTVMTRVHEDNQTSCQHQRTKSSPFPYRGPEVLTDLRRMSTTESASDLDSVRGPRTTSPGPASPPGSPPPPYSVEQVEGAKRHAVTFSTEHGMAPQFNVVSMEDDEFSDHDSSLIEDHGPYSKISTLLEAKPYLAVFINYLLCNEDPSNLFFLLITDHYKEGTSTKDMCRWAFEINTTFLVPNAPLKVQSVDEVILREIDDVLTNFASKEERIRTVFLKARKKASSAVKIELDDFRNKRQAGLAVLFGPSDEELKEVSGDCNKELKVVETLLLTKLQEYARDDLELSTDDKSLACGSALATILSKVFNLKSPAAVGLLEKCPTFVAREKSVKTKLLNKTKKNVSVRGHEFTIQSYLSIVECLQCTMILWGVSPQGYQCKNCKINFHKGCLRIFESSGAVEPCVVVSVPRKNTPFTKWVGIRKPTLVSNGPGTEVIAPSASTDDSYTGERSNSAQPSASFNGKGDATKVKRDDSFKDSDRPEFPSPQGSVCDEEIDGSHGLPPPDSKRQRSAVGRADSFGGPSVRKTGPKKARDSRKHSDPNPPPSTGNNEDVSGALAFAHSGSSSNSSLSARSLDSPGPSDSRISTSVPSDSSTTAAPWGQGDSDLEADTETPDWTKTVESEILRRLTAKEKQRQEVINELFHTERSHVRCLKVLESVFHRPLTESNLIPTELLNLLFASLSDMIDIHSRFNTLMKQKRKSRGVIDSIADIVFNMFDGPEGDRLQRAASQFCQHQSVALEALKERRKKDTKLEKFLFDTEMNPVCRRLQLKDLLPTGMQRLTKYPLLLESLLKHTPPKHPDHQPIKRALERSREVLKAVNAAIHASENQHRLSELQKRLDKSSFDKTDELRNLDLTRHKLVHEGPLTWRCKDRRPIDLHVLVLEDMIVLLQKDDNKFILKHHSVSGTGNSEPVRCSPTIKYTSILLKADARDSTAFYLIDQPTTSPQMYEMVSSSTAERKAWLKHITEATEGYMHRDGKKRPEPTTVTLLNLPAQTSSSSLLLEQDRTNSEESNEVPADNSSADSGVGLNVVPHDSANLVEVKLEPEHQISTDSTTSQSPEPPKKVEEEALGIVSRSASTVSTAQSPAKRRFQRVEILQIAEGTTLIDPKEVKVSQGNVHTAEPVLTPLEKLRRKDQLIRAALVEKQRLVAEVLHVSPEELDQLAQYDSTPIKGANHEAQEARDLVLAAIMQASKLTTVLNESLRITEEETIAAGSEPTNSKEPVLVRPLIEHVHPTRECDPVSRHESIHVKEIHKPVSPRTLRKIMKLPGLASQRLVPIAATLISQLTQLMVVINERDAERDQMRRELTRLRDQAASSQVSEMNEARLSSVICQNVEEESDIEDERLTSESPEKIIELAEVIPESATSTEAPAPCEPCLERLSSESPPRSRPLSVVSLESVGDGVYVELRGSAFIDRQLSNPKPTEEMENLLADIDVGVSSLFQISSVSSLQDPILVDESENTLNLDAIPVEVDQLESILESILLPKEETAVLTDSDDLNIIDQSQLTVLTTIAEVNAEELSSNNSDAPPLVEDFGAVVTDIPDDSAEIVESVNDTVVEQLSDSLKLPETLVTASEA